MMKTYSLQPEKKMWKQGYMMQDGNGAVVYEAKVLKQSIFGSQTVEFINRLTGKSEQHKIGAVISAETVTGGMLDVFSRSSHFKIDGKKIWDHLHEKGVRIDSGLSGGKLGMTYKVTLRGQEIASIATSTPKGKALVTTKFFLDVTVEEENLDLAFLTAYAIAKTEQTFYN